VQSGLFPLTSYLINQGLASADFFSDVNKLVPCGSPPSLSFIDKIFKSCQSDWLVRKRKVSSDDLSFARWLEKVSLAC